MPTPYPTVEELVATLRNSDLPTVIVEGNDDMRIYRWVERHFGSKAANVQATGGRDALITVYERRQEFSNVPVAFVADRDMWLFSGIPSGYDGVIWTEGYSIENDLYAGAELENMLDAEEAKEHQRLLNAIVEWFAFEVEEYLAGRDYKVSVHCDQVVPRGQPQIAENFRNDRGVRPPSEEMHRQIREVYQLKLRGKLLFQMLVRFLSTSNRDSKHSIPNLHEWACKMTAPSNPLFIRIIQDIERTIAEQKTAIQNAKSSQ